MSPVTAASLRSLMLALAVLAVGSAPVLAVEPGMGAPPLKAVDLQQQSVDLGALRGRPVLVMFWATWCGPCREELPQVQAAYAKQDGKGLAVIAVNAGEERADVAGYVKKIGLTFPVVLDDQGEIAARFGVAGLPTNVLIDAEGTVQAVMVGGRLDSASLEAIIERYGR